MVETVQTKEQIESKTPISPVRYKSPPGPKPLSTVFTVQNQENNLESVLQIEQLTENAKSLQTKSADQPNGLTQLGISPRKPSLSFKQLARLHSRLSSEMGDSRVKLKALEFDKLSDHSEGINKIRA